MNMCSANKVLICFGLLVTGGCAQSSKEAMPVAVEPVKANVSPVSSNRVEQNKVSKKQSDPARLLGRVHQWVINGKKFSSEDKPLRLGSIVYNQLMKQPGKLNGVFVVSSAQKPEVGFVAHQIAKGVYELQVLDAERELMAIYRDLITRFGEAHVEMGIDYSPIEMEKPTY